MIEKLLDIKNIIQNHLLNSHLKIPLKYQILKEKALFEVPDKRLKFKQKGFNQLE